VRLLERCAALPAENHALHARIRDLEAQLGQTSAHASRPFSSNPPQAPVRPKAPPAGRSAAANRNMRAFRTDC